MASCVAKGVGPVVEYMIDLPSDIDSDQVQAAYSNGVLTVTVPKARDAQPRRIEIQAKGDQQGQQRQGQQTGQSGQRPVSNPASPPRVAAAGGAARGPAIRRAAAGRAEPEPAELTGAVPPIASTRCDGMAREGTTADMARSHAAVVLTSRAGAREALVGAVRTRCGDRAVPARRMGQGVTHLRRRKSADSERGRLSATHQPYPERSRSWPEL